MNEAADNLTGSGDFDRPRWVDSLREALAEAASGGARADVVANPGRAARISRRPWACTAPETGERSKSNGQWAQVRRRAAVILIDAERDAYEVMHIGWDGERRVHGAAIHIDIIGDKSWVQYDGTPARG